MARKRMEPIYIRPEAIEIGDTINVVTREIKGVTTSKLGTVAYRDHEKHDTVFYTSEGGELMRYSTSYRPQRITLLDRVEREQGMLPLFDMTGG
jgi:hypothetical protein